MTQVTRRGFGGLTLGLAMRASPLKAATSGLESALSESVKRHGIPLAAAAVASKDRTIWSGGVGLRDSASGVSVGPKSIFSIASMTKAITTTAVMQLLEQGKVALHEPVGKYLPALAKLEVLDGFNNDGKAALRTSTKPVTLHHLLTHTSGFVYDMWDQNLLRYNTLPAAERTGVSPLAFEPGTRWEYGTGIDWAGRIVETISGLTLEQYFQRNILQPLGMEDTSFICPAEKFDRLVTSSQRQKDGSLKEDSRQLPAPPKSFNGGGGLYSTCADYVKFMQMILRQGEGSHRNRILQTKTITMMSSNQIGDLSAGRLKTARPNLTEDVDMHPDFKDRWTYGFLMNPQAYKGGRSAGSLAWAGLANTFYWIDPKRSLCAVLMMQFYPFVDKAAVAVLGDFEKAVYATAL